ncbi:MAG: type IV secretion system DNA-binding domain-containing protein, partial [Acidobacteriaceae bacterium]
MADTRKQFRFDFVVASAGVGLLLGGSAAATLVLWWRASAVGLTTGGLLKDLLSAHLPLWWSTAAGLASAAAWGAWLHQTVPGLNLQLEVAVGTGTLLVGIPFTLSFGRFSPDILVSGRRLAHGPRDVAREARGFVRATGPGILIHPRIRLSKDQETRGVLITGTQGSGKTTIITRIIHQVLLECDSAQKAGTPSPRLLISDSVKGDFTEWLCTPENLDSGRVGLVGPWDARSMRWSLARDLINEQHAYQFASDLIPLPKGDGADWAEGAQTILVGLINMLMRERGRNWTWTDLLNQMFGPYSELREKAIAGNRLAERLMPPEENRTVQSYLSKIGAGSKIISALAHAESSLAHNAAWSSRDWFLGKSGPSVMILRGSTEYADLSRMVQSAIFKTFVSSLG